MTGSTRKPTVLLSLVKDKKPGPRFANLEALTNEQRELAQRYQRIIAPGSVLVGVVLGSLSWDIRPVILQRGAMTITRMFSPELLASVQLSDAFKSYIFHIERLAPGRQLFTCGSAEGYSWVTRKYFNQLLSDVAHQIPLNEKISLMSKLLGDLDTLQQSSLIHGHIHPTNIAYEDGAFILIDHGFQIHDPSAEHPATLAPELRAGVAGQLNATIASDMYGIGLVAKRLFGSELGLEFGNLIEVLLLSDPRLRPKLSQITAHFSAGTGEQPKKEDAGKSIKVPRAPIKLPKLVTLYLPLGVAVMVGLYLLSFPVRSLVSKKPQDTAEDFEKFWTTNQGPLMQQVVSKALNGDEGAREYIFEKIASGFTHPAIQKKLFDTGINPLWESELAPSDKEALLTLGLTSLVPADKRKMPDLRKLHPGVLLAIIGTMAMDPSFQPFAQLPIAPMTRLPSPYGPAFASLQKLGVSSMQDGAAQALCHLLTLDAQPPIVLEFLNAKDPAVALARLEVLHPLFDIFPTLDGKVFDAFASLSKETLFSWYAKDVVAQWNKIPAREKLLLFAGTMPQSLSQEQYIDLLRFPRNNVREKAKTALQSLLPAEFMGLLEYLSNPNCLLTRTQSISLLSALRLDSQNTLSYILQWFDTNPDPSGVLKVLLETGTMPKLQAFNIEAARYLIDKKWEASIEDLARLAGSSEPLARTLAYARLNITVPEERQIIEKLAALEPIPRIRDGLLQRLAK